MPLKSLTELLTDPDTTTTSSGRVAVKVPLELSPDQLYALREIRKLIMANYADVVAKEQLADHALSVIAAAMRSAEIAVAAQQTAIAPERERMEAIFAERAARREH